MKKTLALALCLLTCLGLAACAPSPSALTVSGRKVDASEYAFFLHYDQLSRGIAGQSHTPEELTAARAGALDRITTHEVVRLQCKALGLKPSEPQEQELADRKADLIESLGGQAAYMDYLQKNAMTDRLYDKLQENGLYYDLLYQHVTQTLDEGLYTDEALRRYFGEQYILVKYVRVSLLDDDGHRLDSELTAQNRQLALAARASAVSGAPFDTVIAEHNDDPMMTAHPEGVVVSGLELQDRPWLKAAFSLKNGQISDLIQAADGFYVLKRLELSAGYFEANREYILKSAQVYNFERQLAEWKAGAVVKTRKVIDEITLINYMTYVK